MSANRAGSSTPLMVISVSTAVLLVSFMYSSKLSNMALIRASVSISF